MKHYAIAAAGLTIASFALPARADLELPRISPDATVTQTEGLTKLTLKYSGGEKTVVVPSDAKIVKLEPGDRSRLKPGAHLFALASRQEDGTLRVERVTVGNDGVVPPM